MALWRNPAAYDDQRGSVKSWLMGMVHHRAVDLVRREESLPAARREDPRSKRWIGRSDPPTRSWSRSGCRRNADACGPRLDELPEAQRDVLERMYFDGMSQTQIAEATGLPARHREVPHAPRHASSAGRAHPGGAMTRDHTVIEELLAIRSLGGLDGDDVARLDRELAAHGDCEECRRLTDEYAETAGRLGFALDPTPVDMEQADEILRRATHPATQEAAPPPVGAPDGRARSTTIPAGSDVAGARRSGGRRGGAAGVGRGDLRSGAFDRGDGLDEPDGGGLHGRHRGARDGVRTGEARRAVRGLGLPGPGGGQGLRDLDAAGDDAVSGGCVRPHDGSIVAFVRCGPGGRRSDGRDGGAELMPRRSRPARRSWSATRWSPSRAYPGTSPGTDGSFGPEGS